MTSPETKSISPLSSTVQSWSPLRRFQQGLTKTDRFSVASEKLRLVSGETLPYTSMKNVTFGTHVIQLQYIIAMVSTLYGG